MLGGGGVIALYAVGCLIGCAILAISEALAAWLSALIVGVALLAVAGAAALVGKSRLRKAAPPVPQTPWAVSRPTWKRSRRGRGDDRQRTREEGHGRAARRA